ncbi:methionine/alanine import family NSS transporter small subunit [Caenibacillus caldisaponilyticus]|nr:methionine/alanine import family NSS transporter small subunit [Caenibacillus caldisaponilyticus]
MSGSAIAMMIIGMAILWGGLAFSIANMVRQTKKSEEK